MPSLDRQGVGDAVGGVDGARPARIPDLLRAVFALRYWLIALLIYAVVFRHLQNIDPAQPTHLRVAKHAWFSGLGAFGFVLLNLPARRRVRERLGMFAAWALSLGFLVMMSRHVIVSHANHERWLQVIHWLAVASLVAAASTLPLWLAGRTRACIAVCMGAIALLILARACVLLASTRPWIDVFTLAKEASAALWRGENPYAADYSNLYQGTGLDLGYSPGYNYFPAMLFANALSAKLFGDVRACYVLAEALAALLFVRAARAFGWSWSVAWMLSLAFCANSLSFQLVEKWNDSLALAAVLATFVLLAEERWFWSGVAFGLGCAAKQYVPLAALPLLLWVWRVDGFVAARRCVVGTAASFLVVCLPFLLNQPDWFLHRALFHFANTPFRGDSMSVLNGLRIWLDFPETSAVIRVSPFVGLIVGFGGALWIVARCGRPAAEGGRGHALQRLLTALLLVWAAFFHSIKQSHLNYHYFYFSLACLLLFGMVEPAAGRAPAGAAAPAAPV
jgi:hypothetical protein